MLIKSFYNSILNLTFTPCGNYLVSGDIYGQITVFNLYRLMNPDLNGPNLDTKPHNSFTVQEDVQINSILATESFLIVGVVGEIFGYTWKVVKNSKDGKVAWKIELPYSEVLSKPDVNCMVAKDGLLYAGCGDNKIYVINLEGGHIIRTLVEHSDYIHSIFNAGDELASGGEDGVVNIWDIRDKEVTFKIEPYKNDGIARNNLGKWIGAVSISDDWLLCGGGPKLSLWHFRCMSPATIFPINDQGIHYAEIVGDKLLAGGRANHFYNMAFNGDVVSQIPTSSLTVFTAAHQENPYRAMCMAGSSPKIDICSNFNYRDQVLTLE
ncbi:THO complex subunit 6 [Photinus pyralis]|nr:THO complex subunit 6 [Photinus pyralis]